MEDPQTNIWVPIGYCNVGNLCAYIIALEFAVCSLRQQAQDNLAQQFFWDEGPSNQASLCSCPLERLWSRWASGLALRVPQLDQSVSKVIPLVVLAFKRQ